MVIKVKEKFEKTRNVENNDKCKKYFWRGERNARYFNIILSKSNMLPLQRSIQGLSDDILCFSVAWNFIDFDKLIVS